MTDQTAQATQLVLDKVDQYLQQVTGIIQHYTPDAIQLGMAALRVDALCSLMWPICWLILFYPAWLLLKKAYKYELSLGNDAYVTCVFGGLPYIIFTISSFIYGLNIWAWVGLFNPKLYAIHRFLL